MSETKQMEITRAIWDATKKVEKKTHKDGTRLLFVKTAGKDGGEWRKVTWKS